MPTIVDFPTIVKQAREVFGDLFDNAPARRPFAASLTGVMVAERKTVSGLNREFALTTDQSCVNRWLTETAWEEQAFTDRRLEWLQHTPTPRYRARGVIALANTRVDHAGKLSEEVGWFWDHAAARYVIAHDSIISHSAGASGRHYPIEWRRFKKRDAGSTGEFQDHTTLCLEWIEAAIARGIPGDCTFDRSFTSAKVLNHLHGRQRADVGDSKLNRNGVSDGREQQLNAVAQQMRWQDTKPIRSGHRRYWYFSKRMRLPDVAPPGRMVLFWKKREAPGASTALVRNWGVGEVIRRLLVYRHRWTGTETFHRDGKQQLGLGDCQGRSGEGQTRQVSLVSAAYRVLMSSLQQGGPQDWARRTLTTIGEACRAVQAETLEGMGEWIADKLTGDHWSVSEMKAVLVYDSLRCVIWDCKTSVTKCELSGTLKNARGNH